MRTALPLCASGNAAGGLVVCVFRSIAVATVRSPFTSPEMKKASLFGRPSWFLVRYVSAATLPNALPPPQGGR